MSSKILREFLRDERGSYTLWSLSWFILYVALGGLAVDVTDAYRNQTLLQSTADSAALAAIMSVGKSWENPVAQANQYAALNMAAEYNGDVLVDSDITLGNWDFATRTFTQAGTPVNAVHVATRRASENGNPVIMNMLRILGLFGVSQQWDVSAEAIAVAGVSVCHNNGLIAGRQVSLTVGNDFYNNICVHGVEGLIVRESNTFEQGVATSTTCFDCVGPDDNDPSDNEGWNEAWARGGENDPLHPLNANMVDDYVDVLKELPDLADYQDLLYTYGANYANWRYLFRDDGSPPDRVTVSTLPDTLVPHTVYMVNCQGNMRLPYNTPIRNVAIVSSCTIQDTGNPNNALDLVNVAIAADFDSSDPGIKLSAKGNFGNRDCDDLGMVELYTNGSDIKFAAEGDVNSVRLISARDIEWAAKANGTVGVMAEAVRDIKMTSQSDFGLCPNESVNGPNQYTYRLVL